MQSIAVGWGRFGEEDAWREPDRTKIAKTKSARVAKMTKRESSGRTRRIEVAKEGGNAYLEDDAILPRVV